ncbi:MAG: hypothetical protein ACK55I_20220, partial [bacterium]
AVSESRQNLRLCTPIENPTWCGQVGNRGSCRLFRRAKVDAMLQPDEVQNLQKEGWLYGYAAEMQQNRERRQFSGTVRIVRILTPLAGRLRLSRRQNSTH